jgi:hypothetical protein
MENKILIYTTFITCLGVLVISASNYLKKSIEKQPTAKEYKTPFYLGDDGKLHRNTKYTD